MTSILCAGAWHWSDLLSVRQTAHWSDLDQSLSRTLNQSLTLILTVTVTLMGHRTNTQFAVWEWVTNGKFPYRAASAASQPASQSFIQKHHLAPPNLTTSEGADVGSAPPHPSPQPRVRRLIAGTLSSRRGRRLCEDWTEACAEQQVSHFDLFTFRHFSICPHSPHPRSLTLPPKIETNTPAHWRSACHLCFFFFFARSPAGVCDHDCRELCYCCALCPGPAGTSFILPALPTVQLYEAVTLLCVPAISWQSLMHATLRVLTPVRVRARRSEKGSCAE